MNEMSFVDYLNTLHNYNAKNSNAYGESNIDNKYYDKVRVKMPLGNYIKKLLESGEPQVIILTGHAGDGKTSILYQVLTDFSVEINKNLKRGDVVIPSNNREFTYVKDFSEYNEADRLKLLKELITYPNNGKSVFLVANTGPLINTYGDLYSDNVEKEKAKVDLIDALSKNTLEVASNLDYKINVINVAGIDNTSFSVKFLDKITDDKLWEHCATCENCKKCPIYNNICLIKENRTAVTRFLKKHYTWLSEHSVRLTVRSITEQLAYMITGGLSCNEINSKNYDIIKYLFTNLFFGYSGLELDEKAKNIVAINAALKCEYDKKKFKVDETLFISRDFNKVFSNKTLDVIKLHNDIFHGKTSEGGKEFLRRMYLFLNTSSDDQEFSADVFSDQFERFLSLSSDKGKLTYDERAFICDALKTVYLGYVNDKNNKYIPITMTRESGFSQNVQICINQLSESRTNEIQVELVNKPIAGKLDEMEYIKDIYLKIMNQRVETRLTLPVINYFDDLRKGIISTDIDPLLSHGIESIKSSIIRIVNEISNEEDDRICLIVVSSNKVDSIDITVEGNGGELRYV